MTLGRCAAALVAAVLLGVAPAASARGQAGTVNGWIEVGLGEIASHQTNPPRAARGLALVSVAMLDASTAPAGHRRPAVEGAAVTVLSHLFPDRAQALEERVTRPRSWRGWALGRRAGARVVRRARADGSDAPWEGSPPAGPGLWVPTPPGFAPPLEALAGSWRPWNIGSGSALRPGLPPRFGSRRQAREVREVYRVSRELTESNGGSPSTGPTGPAQ